ncbi:MAG: branched-chain amino acid transport system II carrier protein [Intestinibacter sp.]
MVVITNAILGKPGKIILGIIVSLACLTTSIGLTSSAKSIFQI